MGVVEPPCAIAAGADIGEHPLMLGDFGAGEPRCDPVQPGPDEIVVAPGHRDQPEWWVDGEALADGVLAVGAMADSVDSGQVAVADLRHRAPRAKRPVQEGEGVAPAVQQWELPPQAVNQPEQTAAQAKAAV